MNVDYGVDRAIYHHNFSWTYLSTPRSQCWFRASLLVKQASYKTFETSGFLQKKNTAHVAYLWHILSIMQRQPMINSERQLFPCYTHIDIRVMHFVCYHNSHGMVVSIFCENSKWNSGSFRRRALAAMVLTSMWRSILTFFSNLMTRNDIKRVLYFIIVNRHRSG